MKKFFDLAIFEVLHIVDENYRDIWNPEEFLGRENMLFIQKY